MGGGQGEGRIGTENYSFNYNLFYTVFKLNLMCIIWKSCGQ